MFFGRSLRWAPFLRVRRLRQIDKAYFLDTLFDLINESNELETELQDIRAEDAGLKVAMKDGTRFVIQITEE